MGRLRAGDASPGAPAGRGVAPLLALLLAAPAGPALAAEAPPRPFAFTVAGGVSLGAYEAGRLHYQTELLKANPALGRLVLVTGASAGSVNGLVGILSACAPDQRPAAVADSLFWRTWIPLGFDSLRGDGRHGGAQAAFSRGWAERIADELEVPFRAGLREDCDVVLGVSVTRVVPRRLRAVSPGLDLPRVEEKFAVRIRGRGPGRAPRLTNYVSATERWPQHLLPEDADGEVPWTALRDLLFASTAFPVAFEPQPLAHCAATPRDGAPPRCPAAEARAELFVDGGVFDNSPLRLAAILAEAGLEAGPGGARWREVRGAGRSALPEDAVFVYVTPDPASYPEEEAPEAQPAEAKPAIGLALGLAEAFFDTARAKNVATFLEEYPEVVDRLVIPLRTYPAASAHVGAFLGFFERDFREFDFTLGAHDARRSWTRGEVPAVLGPTAARPRLPEEAGGGWRALGCMTAVLDERPGAVEACAGDDLSAFRVLLQASIFQLWDRCARSPEASRRASPSTHCREAASRPPLRVPGLAAAGGEGWRRAAGEREAAYFTRLLGDLGFEWRDLGLARGEGREALFRVRERIGEVTGDLSGRQPAGDGLLMTRLAGLAADTVAYAPPRWVGWLAIGRNLELGASRRLFPWSWAISRAHLALELEGLQSALSSDPTGMAPALLGGVELRPRHAASSTWQPSLLLRAGMIGAPKDGLGARACPADTLDVGRCTRPVAQVAAAVSLLESGRLQLTGEWLPRFRGARALWALSPSLGLQVAF